jgi:hypothetical protein
MIYLAPLFVFFMHVGGNYMYDKMNEIRSKQEQLAQLHFDLDLQQDMRR